MKKLMIKAKGVNYIEKEFAKLNEIVEQNWDILFSGAIKLNLGIKKNYYAPERIQGEDNDVRLHRYDGVKIIGNWHCRHSKIEELTVADLEEAIVFIQKLFDNANQDVFCPFEIVQIVQAA